MFLFSVGAAVIGAVALIETETGPRRQGSLLAGIGLIVGGLGVAAVLTTQPWRQGEGGKQTKSLNNMKQLALALQYYSQDYGETLPGWVRNPDGRLVHNTWDEQISSQVKSKDVFTNGDIGIRSPSDPNHARVLTYGINGLLITQPRQAFDGNADWSRPAPGRPSALSDPASTILFAELETDKPAPAPYGQVDPAPFTGATDARPDRYWADARPGWIDIDPRAWVENNGERSYDTKRSAGWGVARTLYGGWGNVAYADGHARFIKLADTVGLGKAAPGLGTIQPGESAWSPKNTANQWMPRR